MAFHGFPFRSKADTSFQRDDAKEDPGPAEGTQTARAQLESSGGLREDSAGGRGHSPASSWHVLIVQRRVR